MTSTIYDTNEAVLTKDVQSPLDTALRLAQKRKRAVVVEDHGTGEVYRITPNGHRWAPPQWWEFRDSALGQKAKLYSNMVKRGDYDFRGK